MDHLGTPPQRNRERGSTAITVTLLIGAVILAGLAVWLLVAERPPAPPAAIEPTGAPGAESATGAGLDDPADRMGEVTVTSSLSGAVVSVDGERKGTAPQTMALEAGAHTIQVEKRGFRVFKREVQVVPGRTVELEARLEKVPPSLVVRADVDGAQVFLDRKFLGETPVTVRDVERGRHRLNVSVDGYEMHTEEIDIADGRNEVVVSFKEVRLDESVAVKHKHGLGSCEGRLVATTEGLRYETDHDKDGFSVPLSALEPLEVDYMKKNLRAQVRGGRRYNFTAESADDLLVFQKAVEAARERLQ